MSETCTQKSDCGHVCGRPHHAWVRWPGVRGRGNPTCWHHLGRAVSIAEQMGFQLDFDMTPAGLEFEAAMNTVEDLGGDPYALPNAGTDPGREG